MNNSRTTLHNEFTDRLNPDMYYSNDNNNNESKYYLTNDFIDLIKTNNIVKENSFSVLSLNIRSLPNKFEKLQIT
jgi:hypothetical protein